MVSEYFSRQNRMKHLEEWNSFVMARKEVTPPLPIITLSREYGCDYFTVCESLLKLFGGDSATHNWVVVDRGLIKAVAERKGLPELALNLAADAPSLTQNMMKMFLGQVVPDSYRLYEYITKTIMEFTQLGNVVVVGNGGAILTKNQPMAFHFRLVAPLEHRIEAIRRLENLSRQEAVETIERRSEGRSNFIKYYTGEDVNAPHLYDLIINLKNYSEQEAASLIHHYIHTQLNRK